MHTITLRLRFWDGASAMPATSSCACFYLAFDCLGTSAGWVWGDWTAQPVVNGVTPSGMRIVWHYGGKSGPYIPYLEACSIQELHVILESRQEYTDFNFFAFLISLQLSRTAFLNNNSI
jgi:hypothetical protein